MRCPNCSTQIPATAWECPKCGLIVAKIKEKQEREKKAAEALLAKSPAPTKPIDMWKIRAVAIFVVAAWLIGLVVYFRSYFNSHRPAAKKPSDSIYIRDPETGDLKRVVVPPPGETDSH